MLFMHFQINLNKIILLIENFETINKALYAFYSFEQKRQNNNITTIFVLNNKIDENLNIIIKKFKCYNCNKTDHKVFAYFNEYIFNQNFSN